MNKYIVIKNDCVVAMGNYREIAKDLKMCISDTVSLIHEARVGKGEYQILEHKLNKKVSELEKEYLTREGYKMYHELDGMKCTICNKDISKDGVKRVRYAVSQLDNMLRITDTYYLCRKCDAVISIWERNHVYKGARNVES